MSQKTAISLRTLNLFENSVVMGILGTSEREIGSESKRRMTKITE
jgi:hypothetical protein